MTRTDRTITEPRRGGTARADQDTGGARRRGVVRLYPARLGRVRHRPRAGRRGHGLVGVFGHRRGGPPAAPEAGQPGHSGARRVPPRRLGTKEKELLGRPGGARRSSPPRRPPCGPRSPSTRRRRCSKSWPAKAIWRRGWRKASRPTPWVDEEARVAGRGPRAPRGVDRKRGASRRLDDPLSERELEVLALLASGRTNSEVASDLFVSVGTVKSHTGNIYRKLAAHNRAEALARARELGLLP